MIIMGTITEVASDDPDAEGTIRTVDLGIKKPGRSGARPTFFRIVLPTENQTPPPQRSTLWSPATK